MSEDDSTPLMSDEQIDRLRGIKRHGTQSKHGTYVRAAFSWLAIAFELLGYPLYLRLMGLAMPDLAVWLAASFGFVMLFFGLSTLCNEWRKEE